MNHSNLIHGQVVPADRTKLVLKTGKVHIYYTTPCFAEKAPNPPMDMLNLGKRSVALGLDGWDFFRVKNYYSYATGPWDDLNAPFSDQAVSIYHDAHGRSLSTRNLKGVREAVLLWREATSRSKTDDMKYPGHQA